MATNVQLKKNNSEVYPKTDASIVMYDSSTSVKDKLDTSWQLQGGTEIIEEANLNNYTDIGNYYCELDKISKTLTNCPTSYAFTMKVYMPVGVVNKGYKYIAQLITDLYLTGKQYYRYYCENTSKWTDWVSYTANVPYEIGNRTMLTSGDDLNNYTIPGCYGSSQSANTFSNMPAGVTNGAFTLDVIASVGDWRGEALTTSWTSSRQVLHSYNHNYVYERLISTYGTANDDGTYPINYGNWSYSGPAQLLWTNKTPTSSFAKSTASINDSTLYNFLIIIYKLDISSNYYLTKIVPNIINYGLTVNNLMYRTTKQHSLYYRNATIISNTSITFYNAYYEDINTIADIVDSNLDLIPYKIYGFS